MERHRIRCRKTSGFLPPVPTWPHLHERLPSRLQPVNRSGCAFEPGGDFRETSPNGAWKWGVEIALQGPPSAFLKARWVWRSVSPPWTHMSVHRFSWGRGPSRATVSGLALPSAGPSLPLQPVKRSAAHTFKILQASRCPPPSPRRRTPRMPALAGRRRIRAGSSRAR